MKLAKAIKATNVSWSIKMSRLKKKNGEKTRIQSTAKTPAALAVSSENGN